MEFIDNYGGLYKIELATVGNAFAPIVFTRETAGLKTKDAQSPQGDAYEVDLSFAYTVFENTEQHKKLQAMTRSNGVKARVTDNNGRIYVFGQEEEPMQFAQETDWGTLPADFHSITARVFGNVTWQ